MSNKKIDTFSRVFALGKLIRSSVETSGSLPMAQLETLRFIAEEHSPTMHALAQYHHIAAPSATSHVQELVRLKYIKRVGDAKDRRHVLLKLTPQGTRALEAAMAKRKEVIEDLFKHLSDDELHTFNNILDRVITKH